jgi:hypothetical protein
VNTSASDSELNTALKISRSNFFVETDLIRIRLEMNEPFRRIRFRAKPIRRNQLRGNQLLPQTRSNTKYETEQIDIRNELEINSQLVLIFYDIQSQKNSLVFLF